MTHAHKGFRSRIASLALAAGAVLVTAAGCGGDDGDGGGGQTLTKAQVIARGGAICKQAERMNERLPLPTSAHPFAQGTPPAEQRLARRYLAGTAAALQFSHDGLERLDAPPEDRDLLEEYIRRIGEVAADLRTAAAAPAAEVEALANPALREFQAASRLTAAYGFPKDVCGE